MGLDDGRQKQRTTLDPRLNPRKPKSRKGEPRVQKRFFSPSTIRGFQEVFRMAGRLPALAAAELPASDDLSRRGALLSDQEGYGSRHKPALAATRTRESK